MYESQKILLTFNVVQTIIDSGDFRSWTKCILHCAMIRYGSYRLIYLDKPMGVQEVECDGFYMLSQWIGIIRSCSPVVGSHCGYGH